MTYNEKYFSDSDNEEDMLKEDMLKQERTYDFPLSDSEEDDMEELSFIYNKTCKVENDYNITQCPKKEPKKDVKPKEPKKEVIILEREEKTTRRQFNPRLPAPKTQRRKFTLNEKLDINNSSLFPDLK
jgi:hypothetical protein